MRFCILHGEEDFFLFCFFCVCVNKKKLPRCDNNGTASTSCDFFFLCNITSCLPLNVLMIQFEFICGVRDNSSDFSKFVIRERPQQSCSKIDDHL